MPIYEFKCNTCGHAFDELCRMGETGAQVTCPKCAGVGARLLISAFAAHGLENGFMGVGKTWGGGSKSGDSSTSGDSSKPGDGSTSGGGSESGAGSGGGGAAGGGGDAAGGGGAKSE